MNINSSKDETIEVSLEEFFSKIDWEQERKMFVQERLEELRAYEKFYAEAY